MPSDPLLAMNPASKFGLSRNLPIVLELDWVTLEHQSVVTKRLHQSNLSAHQLAGLDTVKFDGSHMQNDVRGKGYLRARLVASYAILSPSMKLWGLG